MTNGKIVYATEDKVSGSWDIFAVDPVTGESEVLDAHPSGDWSPSVSPDGGSVAFLSWRDGAPRVYVMTIEGSSVRRVSAKRINGTPIITWSPDGKRLAFQSRDRKDVNQLYVMRLSDGRVRKLTNFAPIEDPVINPGVYSPEWVPGGRRIAFVRFKGTVGSDIYTIRPDGTDLRQLTRGSKAYTLSYSPDGKRIAFGSWRAMDSLFDGGEPACYLPVDAGPARTAVVGECNFDIYVARSDGSDEKQLTDFPGLDFFPDWSPDGKQIAFLSDRPTPTAANNDDVFVMNADGTDQRNVVVTPVYEWGLSWQGLES